MDNGVIPMENSYYQFSKNDAKRLLIMGLEDKLVFNIQKEPEH